MEYIIGDLAQHKNRLYTISKRTAWGQKLSEEDEKNLTDARNYLGKTDDMKEMLQVIADIQKLDDILENFKGESFSFSLEEFEKILKRKEKMNPSSLEYHAIQAISMEILQKVRKASK